MLKWLIGFGSVALIAAVIWVSRCDQIHNAEGQGYDIKCIESSGAPAPPGTLVCTTKHEQKTQSGQYSPVWWHVFFTWPEGITALLLLLTLGAVMWQAFLMRKHAEHFEKLADATKDSAATAKMSADVTKKSSEVLAISERAWIVEEMDFPTGPLPHIREGVVQTAHLLYVAFELRNGGKSAAKIFDFRLRFHTVRSVSDLPREPFYGNAPPMQEIGEDGLVLIPATATKIPTKVGTVLEGKGSLSHQEFLDIEQGRAGLVVYGRIEYQSLKERHVNQFCYVWYGGGSTSNDPPRFRIGGPPRYNLHT